MKKKLFILLAVFVALVVTIVLLQTKKTKNRDFKDILDSGRISVITDDSFLGFKVESDSIYGFQFEIMKAFADKYELELQLTPKNDFDESINNLEDGDFDIYADLVPVSANFNQSVLLSAPLLKSRLVLVQRVDSLQTGNIKKQYELARDTVFVAKNSPYKTRIRNLSNEIADTIYIQELENVNIETLIQMVSEGKIKNTVCLECEAKAMANKYENIQLDIALGFNQYHAWAMNKKSKDLAEKLNKFLDEYIESSDYWNLYNKYFN